MAMWFFTALCDQTLVTHIISHCVALWQTQTVVRCDTGVTVVCVAMTLASVQMTGKGERVRPNSNI